MVKVGEHVTLDIVGTTKEYSIQFYEDLFYKIAKEAKVKVLNVSHHKFEPQGSTSLALLSESHMSVHTFPEHGVISFDFFTCGKVHPRIAEEIIKQEIEHTRIVKKEFNRDTGNIMEPFYPSINSSAFAVVVLTIFLIRRFFYTTSNVRAK